LAVKLILLLSPFILTLGAAIAQTSQPSGALNEARVKIDVVLILDTSGSMLKTDPQGLRYEGVKLLLSFLGSGDRLGIVQFAGEAKVFQELEPFAQANKDRLVDSIRSIPIEGAFTDITEGIKLASALLNKTGSDRGEQNQDVRQRVMVLLSDGKVEPNPSISPAFARTLQLVHEVLPELKNRSTKVFTLALSERADRAFLGEVAVATDGLTWYAQTPDDLHRSFAELFLALKRPQVVSQTSRGFSIDGEVEEATFYINHSPESQLALVPPKGEVMTEARHPSSVSWFTGHNFAVITVANPELGDWRVTGTTSEDGFATLLTKLKLLTDWPLVVRAGDEPLVQARLYEDNKPVSIPEMSGVIQFGFQIVPTDKIAKPVAQEPLNDSGLSGDKLASDGIFSGRSGALELGSYKLSVVAKGPTFQRSQQVPFTVKPPLLALTLKQEGGVFSDELTPQSEVKKDIDDKALAPGLKREQIFAADQGGELIVSLSKEAQSLKDSEVKLLALSTARELTELDIKPVSGAVKVFSAKTGQLPKSGRYKIKAVIKGQEKGGVLIEAESRVLVLDYSKASEPVVSKGQALVEESTKGESAEVEKVEHAKDISPIIPVLIISVVNIVGFVLGIRLIKSEKPKGSMANTRYAPAPQLIEALEGFEERASSSVVSFKDPIFKLIEDIVNNRGSALPKGDVAADSSQDVEHEGEAIDRLGEGA
jgi:uncharacterized protein (TIGR03503 family)